jgi:hypothetical protein
MPIRWERLVELGSPPARVRLSTSRYYWEFTRQRSSKASLFPQKVPGFDTILYLNLRTVLKCRCTPRPIASRLKRPPVSPLPAWEPQREDTP